MSGDATETTAAHKRRTTPINQPYGDFNSPYESIASATLRILTEATNLGIHHEVISEAMSRQHYREVAAILRHEHDSSADPKHKEALKRVGNSLSTMFRGDNPRFDHGKFMAASFGAGAANEALVDEAEHPNVTFVHGPKIKGWGSWYQHSQVMLDGKDIGRIQTRRRKGRTDTTTLDNNNAAVRGHDVNWLIHRHSNPPASEGLSGTYESEPDFDERPMGDDFEDTDKEQMDGDGQSAEMVRQTGMGPSNEDGEDAFISQMADLSASVGGSGPIPPEDTYEDDGEDFLKPEDEVDGTEDMLGANGSGESVENMKPNKLEEALLKLPLNQLFEDNNIHRLVRVNFDGQPSQLVTTGNWQQIEDYAKTHSMQRLYNRGSPYGFWYTVKGDTAEFWIDPSGAETMFPGTGDTSGGFPTADGGAADAPLTTDQTVDPGNEPATGTDSAEIDPITADNAQPMETVMVTFPRSQAKQLVEVVTKAGGDASTFTVTEDRFRPALVTAQLPKSIAERIKPFLNGDRTFVFSA
jgi:hypothetical protein